MVVCSAFCSISCVMSGCDGVGCGWMSFVVRVTCYNYVGSLSCNELDGGSFVCDFVFCIFLYVSRL